MKRLAVLLLLSMFVFASQAAKTKKTETVKWYSLSEALKAAEKSPKPLFMDMYTDWCGWCKRLDADTFTNAEIAAYLNKNFYPVKFDAEQKGKIQYRGKTYEGDASDRVHPLAMELTNGRLSYPMTIYLKADGTVITGIPGYQTPEQMEPILHFIATGAYETQKWEDFTKSFKSNL
ncbi:MAG: thioredoxin family protein [Bacteroides sp.]